MVADTAADLVAATAAATEMTTAAVDAAVTDLGIVVVVVTGTRATAATTGAGTEPIC